MSVNMALASSCRAVTSEEVAHYDEKGWVQLKRFIAVGMIARMLVKAKELMGEDGDSNPPYGIDQPYFSAFAASGYNDPRVRPVFEGIGLAVKALMNRKGDAGGRLFNDCFVPRLPAARKTRNQGNGPTSFYQDFITFAMNRSGGMTFWISLEPYGPRAGTMFDPAAHAMTPYGKFPDAAFAMVAA